MSTRRMMVASEAVEPEEWRGSNVIPKAWKQEETISDGWSKIVENCQNGTYKDKYKIGDTKIADFGSLGLAMMQIVAFDEDDLADGSGKAPTTWVSQHAILYLSTHTISIISNEIPSYLPPALSQSLQVITKYTSRANSYKVKIFVLSAYEAGLSNFNGSVTQTSAVSANYTDVPSAPKVTTLTPDGGSNWTVWCRDISLNSKSYVFYGKGKSYSENALTNNYLFIAPCFCL